MSFITATSSLTCHGENLWQGLTTSPRAPHNHTDLGPFPAFKLPQFQDCLFNPDLLEELVLQTIAKTLKSFSSEELQKKWGLILASTKGNVENFIWKEDIQNHYQDPYDSFLNKVTDHCPLKFQKKMTVSNSCASSHTALAFSQKWLKRKEVDHVLVLAFDVIGPFIQNGFSALHALSSQHQVKPFDSKRDGLLLGDGIAACVLSAQNYNDGFSLSPVKIHCEGYSVTRPQNKGEGLYQAFLQTLGDSRIDGIIAHGTGTLFNDEAEDEAISMLLRSPDCFITANKWSIGHTLGASGLIDIIAGCEMLHRQEVPGIQTHQSSQLKMKELFVKKTKAAKVNKILISSLGFGGVNAAAILGKNNEFSS